MKGSIYRRSGALNAWQCVAVAGALVGWGCADADGPGSGGGLGGGPDVGIWDSWNGGAPDGGSGVQQEGGDGTGLTEGGGLDAGGGGGGGSGGGGGGSSGPDGTTGGGDSGGDGEIQPPQPVQWPGWDNATVYFVITDRFFDGNSSNNESYGRKKDGVDEVGTFHGGDFAGLIQKLNQGYFRDLGVTAIWVTAPYEQVHGWVVGGGGGFKHYAYHGYFALDFTRLDANMGTEDELRTFVDTAHSQGIRVVFDVVMNHPGYATAVDLHEFGVDVLLEGWQNATLSDYYDFIKFQSPEFGKWWGPQWIRADLGGGYSSPGTNPLTRTLSFLPDFKTESPITKVQLPPFYANKPTTKAVYREENRVRDYLIEWLVQWVREYGIDGFRCDTVKHVEMEAWKELSEAAHAALREWRAENPQKAFPDSDYPDPDRPFWMTGEVFPHGVVKDAYYDNGFDSLINFEFASSAASALGDLRKIDSTWADYAAKINVDPSFNVLSYISSHDTSLFLDKSAKGNLERQKEAGTLLLLTPGAVQIFYGDENARPLGPNGGDATQGTRSDYVWGANPDVLVHWQKLGQFRKRHRAVGAGAHERLSENPYIFRRSVDADVVWVVIGAPGTQVTVSLEANGGPRVANGAALREAYAGSALTVQGGKVTLALPAAGVALLELVP